MTEKPQDRWQEIRSIHQEYRFFYQVGGGVALVLIGILIGAALFANDPGYETNLYTEILSIGVTVFVLNLLAERREEHRRIRDLQDQLKRDAASSSNEIAKNAVYQMRRYNWLTINDDLCLLQGADLMGTNLKDAHLWKANLAHANLRKANLTGTDLGETDLAGANLRQANMAGAILEKARFDTDMILPDSDYDLKTGEYSRKWTPDTDMTRYTDPNHPDFWQPD